MMKKSDKYYKYIILFILFSIPLLSCSSPSTQETAKTVTNDFIAQLYGEKTQTLVIDLGSKAHVSWMALDQSGDYKYFKIDNYSVNGVVHYNETHTSTEVFNDINVVPSSAAGTGSITDTNSGKLLVTVTYNPRKALVADGVAQSASLVIVQDSPITKTTRVTLNGYVSGICTSCHLVGDHSFEYQLSDSNGNGDPDFEFYLCDAGALTYAPSNLIKSAPLPDGDSVGSYAYDTIDLSGTVAGSPVPTTFTFYSSDAKPGFVLVDAGDGSSIDPTVPPFEIPVLADNAPVDSVGVEMEEGFQALCPYNTDTKTFDCGYDFNDSGITVSVAGGQVNVSQLQVTTGEITPTSDDCSNFGTWKGSGDVFNTNTGDEIIVIGAVTISKEQSISLVSDYKLDGALIIARIKLTRI